ncbi:MAG TPA: hypothetical protein VHE35_11835 [Kofleriaceae bacterium]|nr:hypothetical protein [Kofleriaceae bacterium]
MRAVVLERNRVVGRRIARHVAAVGGSALVIEDPAQLAATVASAASGAPGADATLVCADVFDGDVVAALLAHRPHLRAVLWTAEPLRRSLRHLAECPGIGHVLGRKDFESVPRPWELGMVLRRLASSASSATASSASPASPASSASGAAAAPPLAAFLDWGHAAFEVAVTTPAARDAAVERVQAAVAELQVPRRVAEIAGELTHELLMNALYDAPVDEQGRPRYAHDRKTAIELPAADAALLRFGSDGTRVAIQVRDRFGGLRRRQVLEGLARGLAGGELDRSGGGAGLGLTVCHHSSSALFFDLARDRFTQVTATLDLDLNLRELKGQARSLHVWEA